MSEELEQRRVAIGDYNGKPVIIFNPDSKYPFSFGLAKAKIILNEDNLESLRSFVESNGTEV